MSKDLTGAKVVIVGGGTAGITIAARLLRARKELKDDIIIVEPSDKHYYQPFWTLVGAGEAIPEETVREEKDYIPKGAHWVKARVVEVEPEKNSVTLDDGRKLSYDFLVLTPGLVVDLDGIPGLREGLKTDHVCTIYTFEEAPRTWQKLEKFKGGKAIFTFRTPLKCGGAPQKIMYLADDHFRRVGIRDKTEVLFVSAGMKLFGVPPIREALEKVVKRKGIETIFQRDLIEIKPEERIARFVSKEPGKEDDILELKYDLIHVTPTMKPPAFIKDNPGLAVPEGDKKGWLNVDIYTFQHKKYPNIFGAGDVGAFPTAKTGAAVRKQAPLLVHNLLATMDGKDSSTFKKYNGYSSCPLITGYGRVILAEFDYEDKLVPSFPLDPTKERYSMWLLKKYILPKMYWHGMLRGRA